MSHNMHCIRCNQKITLDQWAHEMCPVQLGPIKTNGRKGTPVKQFHTVGEGHHHTEEMLRGAYRSEHLNIPVVVK